jgi:hypothetical protein
MHRGPLDVCQPVANQTGSTLECRKWFIPLENKNISLDAEETKNIRKNFSKESKTKTSLGKI